MTVLVTGATGFLGRRVVRQLLEGGQEVRAIVRAPGRESVLSPPPTDVCYGDVSDPDALAEACRGIDTVVHLVAVIRGGPRQFAAVNREGTANVAAAAKAAGSVKHLVHLSAIGAAADPRLQYLHSKWQGEQEVIKSGVRYTIIRPSLIFGPGDEFTRAVAALVRTTPVTPVIGSGVNRLQPIYVDDVAACVVAASSGNLRGNRIIAIGGPQQLSYNEIVATVADALGRSRRRINIPVWSARLPIAAMEILTRNPPINRAMLQLIGMRNVTDTDAVAAAFGFNPRPMADNLDYVRGIGFGAALRMNLGMAR